MIIKWGRNGRFMACSGYPTCKTTKPLPEEAGAVRACGGHQVRPVRRRHGGEGGPVRCVPRLFELSDLQEHTPVLHRGEVSALQGGRHHRAEDEAQAGVLRLFEVSRLRFCLVGQARGEGHATRAATRTWWSDSPRPAASISRARAVRPRSPRKASRRRAQQMGAAPSYAKAIP